MKICDTLNNLKKIEMFLKIVTEDCNREKGLKCFTDPSL